MREQTGIFKRKDIRAILPPPEKKLLTAPKEKKLITMPQRKLITAL